MRFFALRYVMENYTASKSEKERMFPKIKENTSCAVKKAERNYLILMKLKK